MLNWKRCTAVVGLIGAGVLGVGCSHGSAEANRDTGSGYGASGTAGTTSTDSNVSTPDHPNRDAMGNDANSPNAAIRVRQAKPAGNLGTAEMPDVSGAPGSRSTVDPRVIQSSEKKRHPSSDDNQTTSTTTDSTNTTDMQH